MRIRRPTVAELLAATALVVASSGTAVAADRYLITSSSQIKPRALRSIAIAARGETAEPEGLSVFSDPGIPWVNAFTLCPPGYEAVSGGYGSDLPPEWRVTSERRFGRRGWFVTAMSSVEHPVRRARLRVIAYCRSEP